MHPAPGSIAAISLVILICSINPSAYARARFAPESDQWQGQSVNKSSVGGPELDYAVHDIGRIVMTITNYGQFGTDDMNFICDGEECPSCQYPVNSNIEYLYSGALWIGAIVGRDTLVSVGSDGWYRNIYELLPDHGPEGAIVRRSNLRSKPEYHPEAISEQDFICTFTDTSTDQSLTSGDDNTNIHTPINVSVRQSSYAWSYEYADDFILFDYKISNIGRYPIKQMYIGLYIDADVYHRSIEDSGFDDDLCGFRRTVPMPRGFGFEEDTVNIAWIADCDGDPVNRAWDFASPVAVTGTRVLQTPNEDLQYSFNWWVSNGDPDYDFGPRLAGTPDDPFRSFGSHLGTPTGDENKYYIMRHKEFDYDQLYTAISHTDQGFLSPPPADLALPIADGYDTRYLLSFGPFDIQPGDTLPITVAYVAGDNFHPENGAADFDDLFEIYTPDLFNQSLDFSSLGENARWAYWVYDNPGVDTDGDTLGDSGRYNWACPGGDSVAYYPEEEMPPPEIIDQCRKVYYAGDGVPDFRAASPPPPPIIRVLPDYGRIVIRWNGQETENAVDVFSGEKDFEGYRVYYSQGARQSDYVLLTSYDIDDYKVFIFNENEFEWEQQSVPLTRDSLNILYGPDFEPPDYGSETDYFIDSHTGDILYFRAQDWNQSDLTDPFLIHKVYPDATRDDPSDTTDEGQMRYYEYEYIIPNLQPSVPYYFSVTAFDYGSLKVDLGALESSPLVNAILEYALPSGDMVEERGMEVIVYPNPYRIDGGYARAGYENRERTRSAERSRLIHFANLPNVCTIRIFTLDGDLVKEIEHNYSSGEPESQHEAWNVISRNTQAVVTGIYLWQVESAMGDQLGKLVIIK
jgi:hypothetical protein